MKTFYELLEVPADAEAEVIKRAFRREIAKYHPDKVQHLGLEFQEIAATKAADLTQAYKTLTDPEKRAEYDALLAQGDPPVAVHAAHAAQAAHASAADPMPRSTPHRQPAYPPPPVEPRDPQFATERQGVNDLMRRAILSRFQRALMTEFGKYEDLRVPGFDVAILPTPGFFTLKGPPRVLGRFVPAVDGNAVLEAWTLASKMKKDPSRDLCVFLMGPSVASATELAVAIAEQRKRPMLAGGKLVLIPVNTTDWSAHVPTDAPPVCKALLARLRTAS